MEINQKVLDEYLERIRKLEQKLDEEKNKNTQLIKQVTEYKDKTSKYTKEEAKLLLKIQRVKQKLYKQNIRKSGHNDYRNYDYYELEDINKPITDTLIEEGLSSLFTFKTDMGFLQIVDSETGCWIQWQTPIRTTEKWKKAIENTGKKGDVGEYMKATQALQTYARRSLYLQALEIAEPNTIEQEQPEQTKKKTAELVLPENTDEITESIFEQIKKDFGTRVEYNKITVRNKLNSMKNHGKIDETQYNQCIKTLEKM